MERISNYEITKRRVRSEFLKYDQENMIRKFALDSDENYLYINFIGHVYRIHRSTGLLEWSEDGFQTCTEGDFNEALTIYDLLCDSKEHCQASGDYINLKSLSALQSGGKKLGDGLFESEGAIFDHKDELFCGVCEKLGGRKKGKGDVAYELPLFDFLSCLIQFWDSDEEFQASLQVFMDKQILDFIRYETVWYAVSHLMKRLKEEMEKADHRYAVIASDRYLEIEQTGSECRFYCEEDELEKFWNTYFDLDVDYRSYIEKVNPKDKYLNDAVAFGSGMRILKQDLAEE